MGSRTSGFYYQYPFRLLESTSAQVFPTMVFGNPHTRPICHLLPIFPGPGVAAQHLSPYYWSFFCRPVCRRKVLPPYRQPPVNVTPRPGPSRPELDTVSFLRKRVYAQQGHWGISEVDESARTLEGGDGAGLNRRRTTGNLRPDISGLFIFYFLRCI